MGQWNPLQFQQVMQALQTLTSLGVCQACQLVGLNGQQLAQKGQGLMGSIPHSVGIMETHINAQLQMIQEMEKSNSFMG